MLECLLDDVFVVQSISLGLFYMCVQEFECIVIMLLDEFEVVQVQFKIVVVEFELVNEELRIVNEEMFSINEEFQSVNEELLLVK